MAYSEGGIFISEYSKSLSNRSNDYEWSQLEYLNFQNEYQGFVRQAPGTGGIGFYLDPSKIEKRQNENVFVIKKGVPIPPSEAFIRVTVTETEEVRYAEPTGRHNNFYVGDRSNNLGYKNARLTRYNFVSNWELLDAGSILRKDYRFQDLKDRFCDYITGAFLATEDELARIETCMSMYCASTPAFVAQKGGVDTSIFGKPRQWAAFNRATSFIRPEFRRESSPYFYKALKMHETPNVAKCIEVNRAYNNMPEASILLPMVLTNEFSPVPFFREKNLCYKPYVQAFMIDMIHIDPVISPDLEKFIEDQVYELINNIVELRQMPYNQDIGSIFSKLPIALARTNCESQATKKDVENSIISWADMYYLTERVITSYLNPNQYYILTPEARTLYIELKDRRDTGKSMKIIDVRNESKLRSWTFDEALESLIKNGIVYRPNPDEIRLVNLKD